MGSQSSSIVSMKVICLVLLVAVAVQAENCQVYRSGLEAIFSKVPKPESLLTPDGHCDDGEGWGCIGEIATTVMYRIAEIGMDPAGVQKCVEEQLEQPAIAGTAS